MKNNMLVLLAAVIWLAIPAFGFAGTVTPSDNTVTSIKIVDGAVATRDLADGAVTDAKISGTISGSKLGVHTHSQADVVGLDVSLSNKADNSVLATKADVSALAAKADIAHDHNALYQKKYSNMIVVAKSGGDFTDVISALNSITDASPNNTYLIKIMPGVYTITDRDTVVEARSYVDIEGSGKNVTKIKKQNGWTAVHVGNVIDSEIRDLSIEAETGFMNSYVIPLIVARSQSFQASNVDINITFAPYGANDSLGVWVDGGKATFKNMKVKIAGVDTTKFSGFWLMNNNDISLENIVIESLVNASGFNGLFFRGANVNVKNFKVAGVDFSNASNFGAATGAGPWDGGTMRFSDSNLYRVATTTNFSAFAANSVINEVVSAGGVFKGINCYNQNYDAVNLNTP